MKKCLVIGGSGFLGKHLVEDLLEFGSCSGKDGDENDGTILEVSVFDLNKHANFDDKGHILSKVKNFFKYNLCNPSDVENALRISQADTVFHCATPSPFSSDAILRKVNIEGTKLLMEKCEEFGVKRFILTSSASCIYEGQDILNANEGVPYAKNGYNTYTDTKIEQEKMVLERNHLGKMKTVAIRPAAIYGPGDELFFPQVIETALKGGIKVIVGNGKNIYDYTYVKNASFAHILAGEKLDQNDEIGGKAYFITNDRPIAFWDMICRIATEFGCKKPQFHIPTTLYSMIILVLSLFIGLINYVFRVKINVPPNFSYDKLAYLTCNRTFDISRAKKLLGYKPKHEQEKSLEITLQYFKQKYEEKKEK